MKSYAMRKQYLVALAAVEAEWPLLNLHAPVDFTSPSLTRLTPPTYLIIGRQVGNSMAYSSFISLRDTDTYTHG